MRPWRSLYARIATVYLVLLLLLAVITVWVTLREFDRFNLELEQRVNIPLAENLAMILEPPIAASGVDSERTREVAAHITAINPALELFVLDGGGRVRAAFAHEGCGAGARVPLAPIRDFLAGEAMLPLMGTMPCTGASTIFTAAPIVLANGGRGYLYVALHGRPYRSAAEMLEESYIARSLAVSGLVALLLAVTIGLVWFAWLTRRLRGLTATVEAFSAGDYTRRIARPGGDEVGVLGRAFNEMAGTIEAQVNALRRSDELRRDLVVSISHDFRTPLTSLRGFAERLAAEGDALPAADRAQYLRGMIKSCEQLARLAGQLSMLSQLDPHHGALRTEPFSAAELVHDIVLKFQPQAQALGVQLSLAPVPELPAAVADIGLIERAVSNLVDNALHNTPPGGEVVLTLGERGGRIMVQVRDTGYGIEPDELALVTQRFYRTRRSRSRSGGGTGLGLAIAGEIADMHGVRLDLTSDPGRGTVVAFELPTDAS